MAEKMTDAQVAQLLTTLQGWEKVQGRDAIHKTFVFGNFVKAFSFMTACALEAEKLNHHPEWSNVYKTVNVVLTTHDAKGVTELDEKLAKKMDRLTE